MKHLALACFFAFPLMAQVKVAQPPMKLWYRQPATYFEEALALGNGKMGATVFGGVAKDQIYLNDITLWSGEPVDPYLNPKAYQHLPAVRKALFEENYALADSLVRKLQGKFSESYAPLGTLFLDFGSKEAQAYYRELDLDRAMAKVQYQQGSNQIERTYFVSHPDRVFVVHLKSKEKGGLNVEVKFRSLLQYQVQTQGKSMTVHGRAPVRAEPNYVRKKGNPILFLPDRGTRFAVALSVENLDGSCVGTDSSLQIKGGTEVKLLVSTGTSFNGFDKDPAKHGKNEDSIAKTHVRLAKKASLAELKARHLRDYQGFFHRLHLQLKGNDMGPLPTDERLRAYAQGALDPYLETLYFQYGRYLLISSSRTLGVPANLQGLWNPHLQPPWSSNYTMNINAEENYWLAENTNLPEMHRPFLSFLSNLEKTGRITAQTFYQAPGWTCHHNSDIWAMTNPVGDFGNGSPSWANWNMGAAWASTHLWEHYVFNKDRQYLKQQAYPLMKGAAEFCLAMLLPDAKGDLITAPSTSPENRYITDKGYKGETIYGATADLAMIRELFLDVMAAAKELNTDPEFVQQIQGALGKLRPYQIGKYGHLMEWYHDWEDTDPKHRHQSHLYGLYPGLHLNVEQTPALAKAAQKTLEIKGDETTGWSKGWRINLWARLKDGNHAYKMYRELLKYVEPDGVKVNYQRGGGTYPNLFDAHPPFQIDGNFGGAAAVVEMLMQSQANRIELLPALPMAWSEGKIKGIKTRGGFLLSMEWKNSRVQSLVLSSKTGGETELQWNGISKRIRLKANENFVWKNLTK